MCQFLRREVTYLGHTISADGVSCESGKVGGVQNWPTPTTTTELRSFLGFASYYRRFISGFARIAGPLHDLMSEGAKHSKKKAANVSRLWGPKHQEAFDSLKGAMTTAPVLGYADYTKPFILETDASHDGLSAILSQEQDGKSRVLAFASRRLRPSEKNSSLYSSLKLEFLAMKWAITDKFRHYLLGGKFKVITDNNPLTYFRSAKLGALEQRWASELAQFDFDIQYRPGKINPADALSRMPLKPSPEPLLTVVPPGVATVNDLQCEQLAVDPTPTAGALATPWLLCCPWTRRRNLMKRLFPRLQLRYSPDCLWLTCSSYSNRIQSLARCSQPGQPSPPTPRNAPSERRCSSTLDGSWRMESSVVGRLTNVVVPLNSWFGPAHFDLMSQERSGATSASARDAPWCHALGRRKGIYLVWSFGNALCLCVNGLP